MALDKLKYTYQDPAKVSELNVDDVLNVTNTINTTTVNSKAGIIFPDATNVGLTLKSASLPNLDLVQIQDNAGVTRTSINSAGNIYIGNTPAFGQANQNYPLGSATATSSTTATFTYGLSSQPLLVGQQVQISSVTPSYFNGIWVVTSISGGSGAWAFTVLGSGFTPGGVGTGFGILRPSPQLSITGVNPINTQVVIQAHPLQISNLMEFFGTGGTRTGYVTPSGQGQFSNGILTTSVLANNIQDTATTGSIIQMPTNNANFLNTSFFTIASRFSNQMPLIVKGTNSTYTITNATANGTTITYNSTNSFYLYAGEQITITGIVSTGNPSATAGSGFNLTNATIASATASQFTVTNPLVDTYTSGGIGSTSQQGDLTQWQNGSGGLLAKVTAQGGALFTGNTWLQGGLAVQGNYGGSNTMAISNNQDIIGLTINGNGTQTADYFQIKNSGSAILLQLNASNQLNVNYGSIYAQGGIRGGSNNHIGLAGVSAFASNAAYLALGVKGAASQTANLTEWQNSGGTVLSAIDPIGNFTKGDGDQMVLASQVF